MALTKLTENLNVHQSLPDKPALSATELKQAFDSAANAIKTYLNETLTDELDTIITSLSSGETSLEIALTQVQTAVTEATSNITTIQASITSINSTLSGLKSGATTKITIGSSVPETLDEGEVYLQYFE